MSNFRKSVVLMAELRGHASNASATSSPSRSPSHASPRPFSAGKSLFNKSSENASCCWSVNWCEENEMQQLDLSSLISVLFVFQLVINHEIIMLE